MLVLKVVSGRQPHAYGALLPSQPISRRAPCYALTGAGRRRRRAQMAGGSRMAATITAAWNTTPPEV